MDEENISDVWRILNANSREYTFFSNRHGTYSRIDMILMSQQLLTNTKKLEILPQLLLDHNPVLWIGKDKEIKYQWRLNERLLSKEENVQKLKDETVNYFRTNLGTGVSIQVVWDAYKAVLRGILMKMGYDYKKKEIKKSRISKN